MPNIIRKPESIKVLDLVSMIRQNKVSLPDFQREFVWHPKQMALLVESILMHYPTGTPMFLKYDLNLTMGKRSFVGTDPSAFTPEHYVIDGQQRLFTLLKLFTTPENLAPLDSLEHNGKYYKIYYHANTRPDTFEIDEDKPTFICPEVFPHEKHVHAEEDEHYLSLGKRRLIPIEFIASEPHTDMWLKKALGHVSNETREACKENILEVRRRIETYTCNIEKIESKLRPEDHYKIFQLLNEAGTDLTVFDLLVAKLSPLGINLRTLWKKCQADYPGFKKNNFDLDPTYILRTISLIKRTKNEDDESQPTCTKKDLKHLYREYKTDAQWAASRFENDWGTACRYINESLEDFRLRYGAISKKYVPYSPMIVTLAAIKWWYDQQHYNQKYRFRVQDKLDKWYWGSVFGQEYESSTDTVIANHYYNLRKWIPPFGNRIIPKEINFKMTNKSEIKEMIQEITTSADARYKAIICLPLRGDSKAKDIYSEAYLESKCLQDHHIFPRAFLKKSGYSDNELINNVANRMLITSTTNTSISDQSPYEYLKHVKRSTTLSKHHLFKEIFIENMSFEDFVDERTDRLSADVYRLVN